MAELDTKTGLPIRFLQRMEQMLGEEYPRFIESFSLGTRYHGLRVNPLKVTPEEFLARHSEGLHLSPIPWAAAGFYYDESDRPGRSVLHEAGLYYIQEPSAMSAVEALDIHPDEQLRVLDLCAAPGGKTTQIAGKMMGKGLLIANEIVPSRAKILSQNIERLGVPNALVLNETPARLAERYPCAFDRILVDAPCSGEGMYRKNEIAVTEWSEENVAHCAERLDEILTAAAEMLAPGGRLVYSTCTFAPVEDEGTIARFLAAHPEFSLADSGILHHFSPGRPEFIDDPVPGLEKTVRVWPHIVNGEGHFVAALVKSTDAPDISDLDPVPTGSAAALTKPQQELFTAFCKEALTGAASDWLQSGSFLLFGEELYRLPAIRGAQQLDRLKVVRSGIHLGSFRKNRFEPAHALALAIPAEYFVSPVAVTLPEAESYIRGNTIPAAAPKGWRAVVIEDGGRYPIGWGKSDGRQIKNHYPKGLRRS